MGVTVIKGPASGSVHIMQMTKSGTTKNLYADVGLRDLTIISQNVGAGVLLYNSQTVRAQNVEIYMSAAAPPANQRFVAQYCSDVTVENVWVHDATGNSISINACDNFTVANNHVVNGVDDGIDIDHDFLEGAGAASIHATHGTVIGNVVNGIATGNGIRVEKVLSSCLVLSGPGGAWKAGTG